MNVIQRLLEDLLFIDSSKLDVFCVTLCFMLANKDVMGLSGSTERSYRDVSNVMFLERESGS